MFFSIPISVGCQIPKTFSTTRFEGIHHQKLSVSWMEICWERDHYRLSRCSMLGNIYLHFPLECGHVLPKANNSYMEHLGYLLFGNQTMQMYGAKHHWVGLNYASDESGWCFLYQFCSPNVGNPAYLKIFCEMIKSAILEGTRDRLRCRIYTENL